MVAPIYQNKKGIYRDLYREIDLDNQKKKANSKKKNPKGIYKNLYKNIRADSKFEFGNKKKEHKDSLYNRFVRTIQSFINITISKISYYFPSANTETKPLIVACMVAKKPINDYIENNVQNSNTVSST